MEFCPEPVVAPKGKRVGPLTLRKATQAFDNARVIINVAGEEREIKLDELIMVNGSWRLMDPRAELLPQK